MTHWTPSARQELEHYFGRIRPGLEAGGADATEVIEDLRRHVEQEAAASPLAVVTEEDVRRLLARIGAPEPVAPGPEPTRPAAAITSTATEKVGPKASWWLLVLGVVLPTLTLIVELGTGMCAGAFFDPVPTPWHLFLVVLVPGMNLWTWWAIRQGRHGQRARLGWANGIVLGVCTFYALLFLPLLLPGVFALIFYGFGLLPWTPTLTLVATVGLRRRLRALTPTRPAGPLPGLAPGLAIGLLALALADAPVWLTRYGLHLAASEDSRRQARGLRWLRAAANDEVLLRACYGRTRAAANMDVVGWIFSGGEDVSADKARELYYRVTGRAFNSVPAPAVRTGRGRFADLDEWTWDADQGGERVGGRLKGLTLQGSRLDAVVDAPAATAYYEWTLEFKNDARGAREARAQVLLPPGGVVSRLTLWVNGEEREAAFAGRSRVREAYQRVAIRQRRDPVLVTTAGPDRVLVQCFPVPPDGGTMKVRLGMTAPLVLPRAEEGLLLWPCFLERNFTVPEQTAHSLWVEAQTALVVAGTALRAETPKPGLYAVRGLLDDRALADPTHAVRVPRERAPRVAWTQDTRSPVPRIIRQTIADTAAVERPTRVVVVVDGSRGMQPHLGLLADTLGQLPAGVELALVLATDVASREPMDDVSADPARQRAVIEGLRRLRLVGGQDNLPALVRAWDLAAEKDGSVILWIHGPQPVLLASGEALRQRYDRRPNGPRILELQTEAGPDRVIEQLDGVTRLNAVPRLGPLAEDLRRIVAGWEGGVREVTVLREPVPGDGLASGESGHETSLHLARLWAHGEITRLRAQRQVDAAVELAARYQLVTPVSGAVVLETQAQYEATGLEPVDPATVPAIPEPSTWLLLALGLAGILARFRRTR
ncbi:MAG: PEP-CTERM sorting domain-containing protein [Verrucomicrobia bacterium]|nr:PEP-CTERM sorting domain-containing protein [Verrucomicrobiota bacterium]